MIRNSVRQVVKRHVSSQSTRPQQPTALSPTKMRALVSLYHQSETFITPETLDARIDNAFLYIPEQMAVGDAGNHAYRSYVELEGTEKLREKIPRISEYIPSSYHVERSSPQQPWSDFQNPRERAVFEAMYGTLEQTKPGWEILEESAERIQDEIAEDRKNAYVIEILFRRRD